MFSNYGLKIFFHIVSSKLTHIRIVFAWESSHWNMLTHSHRNVQTKRNMLTHAHRNVQTKRNMLTHSHRNVQTKFSHLRNNMGDYLTYQNIIHAEK